MHVADVRLSHKQIVVPWYDKALGRPATCSRAQLGHGEARVQTEVLEEGLSCAHGLNSGVCWARKARGSQGRPPGGQHLEEQGELQRERKEQGPLPDQLFCPRLSCDLRRLY